MTDLFLQFLVDLLYYSVQEVHGVEIVVRCDTENKPN